MRKNSDINYGQIKNASDLAEFYILHNVFNPRTARNYRSIALRLDTVLSHPSITSLCDNDLLILNWRKITLSQVTLTSYNTYLRHLKAIFKFAHAKKLIENDPFFRCIFCPSASTFTLNLLNYRKFNSQIHYLESNKNKNEYWIAAMAIRLLILTGIRLRQFTSLKWQDIDFTKQTIKLSVHGSKTVREWLIPLPKRCKIDLLLLKKRYEIFGFELSPSNQIYNFTDWNPCVRRLSSHSRTGSGFF